MLVVDTAMGGNASFFNVSGMQVNGATVVQFSRKLVTSDTYDYAISSTPFYLLYALAASDGFGTVYGQHYETGSALINFQYGGNGSAVYVPTTAAPANNSGPPVSLDTMVGNSTAGFVSPNSDFKVWWNVSNGNITVTMWASTAGWLAVGFSSVPLMPNADIVVVSILCIIVVCVVDIVGRSGCMQVCFMTS